MQTSRMVLNGFFLESRWEDKGESGYIAQGIFLTGYDPVTKSFVDYSFENDGSIGTGPVMIDGNKWTGIRQRTDSSGRVYKLKFTSVFASDGRTTKDTQEYSDDDGKTWKPFFELTMNKVSD
jgi:hypothetical protein